MTERFVSWLLTELDSRGWSQRELARRTGLSPAGVNQIVNQARLPTWDFCARVARALSIEPNQVFVLAGLRPARPPGVLEEQEVVNLLRDLDDRSRGLVISMIRAAAGHRALSVMAEAPPRYELRTADECELIELYRELPDHWQEAVLHDVRTMYNRSTQVKIVGGEE
jgi:transcriptional regulator with XRE-family HTH domain